MLAPVERRVNHPYSDEPEEGIIARCYAFDELFGEKIRALGERTRPRDLYDVINLFRNGEFGAIAASVREVVTQKCRFKNVAFPSFAALAASRDELVGDWKNMLGHQLPAPPPSNSFWSALPAFFQWLVGTTVPQLLPSHPIAAGATVLRSRAGGIHVGGRSTPFIETIRFAAANRLLVELDYVDQRGMRATRPIEAYSLRRTQEGNIILCAVNAEKQESRSYRIEQIQGAQVLDRTFVPRYAIELTPTGPLMVPETARSSSGGSIRGTGMGRRSYTPQRGPTYVYRCAVCGKRFEHGRQDGTLRAHKDRAGRPCYGRSGIYEGTKW